MQAISLIMNCYTKKSEFFDAKPIGDGFKETVDQTKKSEQETKQREKTIQDYIARANLTQEEIGTLTTTTSPQAGYYPS
jgi:predicted GTPase